MGLFDISIRKEITSKKTKEDFLNSLEKKLKSFSNETPINKDGTLLLNSFKTSILKYDLSVNLEKSSKGFNISIDGELQQFYVLILVFLVILGIAVTMGIGVIVVIVFAYLQKHYTTKSINSLIEYIS
ncbi:hypothetical protein [Poseidonibacter antarcticus]|uniref:hypothetical protein n=1 Tax=Poseidonibacter antarcticus TaxID=2478538 RepID=UPI000EF4B7EA|nr:hypothetical protein [Poseidonibacter antarcticus]